MADVFETRCVSESFMGAQDVLRVACIGDSMVYGQGVVPREALPAHLNRFLNAAVLDRLVFVDNFGTSSGNLWHAWSLFKWRAASRSFDAVVFSLCQNDSQLFESNTLPYGSDKLPYWTDDSVQWEQVKKLMHDVSAFCSASDIIPIINFYSLVVSDRPIIERVRMLCDTLNMSFVDMLSHYSDGHAITTAVYCASEFDGHPSSFAHELAARHIATVLWQRFNLTESSRFSNDPEETLGRSLGELIHQGVPVDAALDWGHDVVAAKERAARRKGSEDYRGMIDVIVKMGGVFGECDAAWRGSQRIRANLSQRMLSPQQLSETMPNLEATIRNLEEAVFIVLHNREAESLERLGAMFAGGYFEQERRLAFFAGDISAEVAMAKSRISSLRSVRISASSEGLLTLMRNGLLFDKLAVANVLPEISVALRLAERLRAQMELLEVTVNGRSNPEGADAGRIWAITFYLMRTALNYLETLDELLVSVPIDQWPVGLPWTNVDVVLEGGPDLGVSGNVCRLTVEADYVVPSRGRRREALWAGVTKERAGYHFELPLMIAGSIRVGVADNEPTRLRFLNGTTRIARIDIYQTPPQGSNDSSLVHPTLSWSEPESRLALVEFKNIVL